jgi:hypothetical protein
MTIEDDLRLTLRDRAAEPPGPQPDLVGAVVHGVRRSNRRRAVLGAATAVLAVAVAVPVWLADDRQAQPVQPAVPTPTPSRVPQELSFPLTPGWVPTGVGTGEIGLMGTNRLLQYEGSGVLSVEVGPVPGSWENEGDEDHRANVGGRPATVRTAVGYDGAKPGERYVGVRWKLPDGQWAQVVSFGPRSETQVLRFARELRPQAMSLVLFPFTFAEMPPGLALRHSVGPFACLGPTPPVDNRAVDGLCIDLTTESPDDQPAPEDERLIVGGRPATFNANEIRIEFGAGRVLSIRADPELTPLTRAELIRFAEGVGVAGR